MPNYPARNQCVRLESLTYKRQAGKPDLPARQAGKPDLRQTAAKLVDASSKPGRGRMFVVGRVLDAKGRPVPGATVAAFARIVRLGGGPHSDAMTPIVIRKRDRRRIGAISRRCARARPRRGTSSSLLSPWRSATVLAGSCLSLMSIYPPLEIKLQQERVVSGVGCLICKGGPFRGVTLSVGSIRRPQQQAPDPTEQAVRWARIFVYEDQ